MIIFDLDALADDSHRRHFIDPSKRDDCVYIYDDLHDLGLSQMITGNWYYKDRFKISEPPKQMRFQPDYEAYNAACGGDKPILPVLEIYSSFEETRMKQDICIWTSTSEAYRGKIYNWLNQYIDIDNMGDLKMRPIGDDSPQEELFFNWINDEMVINGNNIEMAFISHKPTIEMFRKRGIFVFDCNQGEYNE